MRKLLLLFPFLLSACIGTDVLDDEIVERRFEIIGNDTSVFINQSIQLSSNYFNQYGLEEAVDVVWNSSDINVISINNDGLANSIGTGQSFIFAAYDGLFTDSILISVVESASAIARVSITNPGSNTVMIGDTINLIAGAFTIDNQIVDSTISWSVSNTQIASIDSNGRFIALENGTVNVFASAGDIISSPLEITISTITEKTATFSGMNNYDASGTARLFFNDDNDLILELSSDFDTDFALGTFIYLANSTNGSSVKGGGLELGGITTDGMHTFNVSDLNPSADLDSYRYAIVLCKPASITFGSADFNP